MRSSNGKVNPVAQAPVFAGGIGGALRRDAELSPREIAARKAAEKSLTTPLTQLEAAARLKWTQSKLAQIEIGQRQVYASELFELAAAYQIDPVDLVRRWADW